jgi:hypothetical protein
VSPAQSSGEEGESGTPGFSIRTGFIDPFRNSAWPPHSGSARQESNAFSHENSREVRGPGDLEGVYSYPPPPRGPERSESALEANS